jgi:hypothetical protein
MMYALMPGLAKVARRAAIVTEIGPCFVCVVDVEPGRDLAVSVGLKRFVVHRGHLADVDVERLLAKAAA